MNCWGICFSGNEVAQWNIFSIQHRLVAPVLPNSCLVLPGLRNLHLSSVRREIVQFNLSDIVEGIKEVTVKVIDF